MPSLILHYYPNLNFAVADHDGEVTVMQGTFRGAVKFTPETWDAYAHRAVGKMLPRHYDGYGWYKYFEDAQRDGLPWVVMNLTTREQRRSERIDYLVRQHGDTTEVIFDEQVRAWLGLEPAGIEIPPGVDRFAIADRLMVLYKRLNKGTLCDADLVGIDLFGEDYAVAQ